MPLSTPYQAAVVFAERRAAAGLRDRLRSVRRLVADGFETYAGRVKSGEHERSIVVAVPRGEVFAAFPPVLAGLQAAHRPALLVGAGFAEPLLDTPLSTSQLFANEVRGPAGETLPVSSLPSAVDGRVGTFVQHAEKDQPKPPGAVASSRWCFDFVSACTDLGIPASLVAVAEPTRDTPLTSESRNVTRQATRAGGAGALIRLVWKEPAGLSRLWRRQEATWEGQEELADAVVELLAFTDASR